MSSSIAMHALAGIIIRNGRSGFTLVELALVLVIVGLITGGVLVGRDIISAAAVRAQLTQIQQYQSAVTTFREKFSYLPGDIPAPYATQAGLISRGPYGGEGDGNWVIQGIFFHASGQQIGVGGMSGETAVFWVDLSSVKLIDGGFRTATETADPTVGVYGTTLDLYLPNAKIGQKNYVYVWSGGTNGGNGVNYFGIGLVTGLGSVTTSYPRLTVQQAYSMDSKVDDGLPQTGRVTAQYCQWGTINNYTLIPVWAAGGGVAGASGTGATPASNTTCYDNGNVAGTQNYSIKKNNGSGLNCALSFQMQ